jgi:two-component system, OmpR family, response regulator
VTFAAGPPKGCRVLLVDDDPALRETMAEVLEEFVVDVAGDVATATAALQAREYQAVIVDFELPDGHGSAVLRSLGGRMDATAQILLTGHGEYPEVRELQRSGKVLVLFKPIDPSQLLTWVRHGVTMTRMAMTLKGRGEGRRLREETRRNETPPA